MHFFSFLFKIYSTQLKHTFTFCFFFWKYKKYFTKICWFFFFKFYQKLYFFRFKYILSFLKRNTFLRNENVYFFNLVIQENNTFF